MLSMVCNVEIAYFTMHRISSDFDQFIMKLSIFFENCNGVLIYSLVHIAQVATRVIFFVINWQ